LGFLAWNLWSCDLFATWIIW